MDKLKMHSLNKVDDNIKKIGALFPNCITERKNADGEVEYAIDFDMLKQELSSVVVEGKEERYQFTWPDKKKSILAANAPISDTLRPCREESVDFDTTQNLYIEGDNLAVLKLLQETYLGKIKMIYIDPPYNTGNDFVYNDDFAESAEEYLAHSGQFDEEGNRLVANTESNGRFHTDWLNMIYPRLKIAKDLLSDDGVIFISIDDAEQENLKKICDEIFGSDNFLASIVIENDSRVRSYDALAVTHEYMLLYRKSDEFLPNVLEDPNKKFQYRDELGGFDLYELRNRNSDFNADNRPNLYYPFWVNPNKKFDNDLFEISLEEKEGWIKFYPQESQGIKTVWRWGKDKAKQNLNTVIFGRLASGGWQVVKKYRESTYALKSVWQGAEFLSDRGTLTFKKLFDNKRVFTFPKPIETIIQCMKLCCSSQDYILDFFSGSATTAHAVMQLNAEDGGNRKFIMVQLPEETDEKSEAYKAGYKNICEIGKERIRRAGKKIEETEFQITITHEITPDEPEIENGYLKKTLHEKYKGETKLDMKALQTRCLDTGFRVLKLDSSNMKDVYYNPDEYEPSMFESLTDNIKADRTPEDLLFQVMLDLGVLLSSKIEETTICGKKVFNVADGFLYACFDNNVSEETITEIAKKKPYYFVMRDSSMANDSVATNFEQIFATYSPETERRVL